MSLNSAAWLIDVVPLAKQDINKIENALNSSGYYFNKVDVEIKNNNNDTVDLIYNISLGEKALIKNIIFTGEKTLFPSYFLFFISLFS